MNRPLLFGLLGGGIIAAAIGMTFVIDGDSEHTVADSAPPAAPSAQVAGATPPTAPPPAVQPPRADAAPVPRPRFDVVRVTPKGDAVIAGRAAPGARVAVHDGSALVGSVVADDRGEWVLVPGRPLAPGTRELTLSMAGDGIAPADADRTVIVVVPPRDGAKAADGAAPLAVAVSREGLTATEVLQPAASAPAANLNAVAPAAGTAAPEAPRGAVRLDTVDYDAAGNAVFGGRAAPDSMVNLYIDNRLVGSAQADDKGAWQLPTKQSLTASEHVVRVDTVGAAGKVTGRAEAPFTPTQVAVSETSIVVVEPGNSLWRIARRQFGRGVLYTVIYEANRQQIRDPDLIYPGQIFRVPESSRVN